MRLFKEHELNIFWPFYLSTFIYGLLFMFGPYMVIYFLDIGLSFKQIAILTSIYALAPIVFEVPTGAFSDYFGRKYSVIISFFLIGIFTILVSLTNNFYLLALLFLLVSASATLSSGADEAWIVDLLKNEKKKKLLHEYYVKIQSIVNFSAILMGILSSFVVKSFGIKITWIIGGVGAIIASLILFYAKESFNKEKININRVINKTLANTKKGIFYSLKNRNLVLLLLAFMFIGLYFAVGSNMWQPFLKDVGIKPYSLGYIYSLIGLVVIGIPFLSKPLLKKIGHEKNYLATLSFFMFLITLSIYYANFVLLAVIIMILLNVVDQLDKPVSSIFFQKLVPSKIRATVGSFKSMVISLGWVIGLIISGFLADYVGPKLTIFYSAFFLIPAIIFYLLIKEKNKTTS